MPVSYAEARNIVFLKIDMPDRPYRYENPRDQIGAETRDGFNQSNITGGKEDEQNN